MPSVCLYFQVHQPFRLKPYDCFMIGYDHFYEDESQNRSILERVSEKSYLPANKTILRLIKKHKGAFKVAYSISGTALEQFEKYCPEVIESFQELAETGCVEFLSETYYHSLSFLYSRKEFLRQVTKHKQNIQKLFHQTPSVFRNTELIYNNDLSKFVEEMGFKGVVCEGSDSVLGQRSPNFLYHPTHNYYFKCLLRNYKLSDDIAFRFSNKEWEQYPLTASKFADWVALAAADSDTINLFMDYETFGEHQWAESGIFEFLKKLPKEILHRKLEFKTPSETIDEYQVKGRFDVPRFNSWADTERDLSAWLGNSLQQDAMERVYLLEDDIKETGDRNLLDLWSKLQTSDHFYYMSTKNWSDGDVHKYFNPYRTPYDAYINFMNIITDLEDVLENRKYSLMPPVKEKKLLNYEALLSGESNSPEYAEPSLYI